MNGVHLIVLSCAGLDRVGIALLASSSLRGREIAFRHRPTHFERAARSLLPHDPPIEQKIQSLESNVEFSGGVCGGVRSVRDSRLARVAVLSISIERVLEGISRHLSFDTLQACFHDLSSGVGGAFLVIF
jgi:hypothetical protein